MIMQASVKIGQYNKQVISMGCMTIDVFEESHIVRNLSLASKEKIANFIENNDMISLAFAMDEAYAYPNSEISDPMLNWNLAHLCCRWDSHKCFEYLLKLAFVENPKRYIEFVNTQTFEGYTYLHLCCVWGSTRCFKVLLDFGAVALTLKDNKLKTPYQQAIEYKSLELLKILHEYQEQKIQFTYIKIERILESPLIRAKKEIREEIQREMEKEWNDQTLSMGPAVQNENQKCSETATMIGDETQLLAQKAEVEKQLGKLLQEKLRKLLEYDLKLTLVIISAEIEELDREEFQKKEKQKIFLELEQEELNAQKDVQSKQQKLKKLNEEIEKRRKVRLNIIKSESQFRAEETLERQSMLLNLRQRQRVENLRTYTTNSMTSSYKRAIKFFKRSPQEIKYKEQLKLVPKKILQLYQAARDDGEFIDKEFPADNSSIGDSSKSKYSLLTENMIWLRPGEIFRDQFRLFDGIDPNDIKQGALGVCYLLATVSALAMNPKNIRKIFVFSDLEIGFYVLRLYVNGVSRFFVVDDLIPCSKTTKSPLFTQPIGKQIWVLLLEKAWAKLVGSYLSAESMTPDHIMEDLSGAPAYGWSLARSNIETSTLKIKEIVKHSELKHIVVITSSDKQVEGIVSSHAYSLLAVIKYNNRYVFKIRNPWGRFQWNGEFGEKSSLCTQDFKKEVGYGKNQDGVFFISENQLLKAFTYYSISHIQPDYCYSYTSFESKKGENLYFRFKIQESGEVNLRITQPFDRMLKDRSYKYSPMIFEVGRISTTETGRSEVEFISEGHQRSYFGAKSVHAFQDIFQKLEEGDYFVRIRMLWVDDKKYNSAVLGCYARQSVNFQRIEPAEGLSLLKSLFVSFSKNSTRHRANNGYYSISTMKGQFLFIGEVKDEGEYKANFKFNKQKMVGTETEISRLTEIELETKITKQEMGVCTAMRIEPAQGGTTGPVSITITKI